MAFTEFCCRSGGSNLNAGTLNGDSTEPGTLASFSYAGTFATNTFTVSAGNPQSDGVVAGNFVHCSDGTNVGRIARITSVTSGTIVLSASATVGSGTGAVQAKVGGAWAGPGAAVGFPIGTIPAALTNVAGNLPRLNLKNDQTYSISTGLTQSQVGVHVEGYTTSYGDNGRATIDGSTNTIVLFTLSGAASLANLILQNNGTTGTNAGLSATASFYSLRRLVVNTVRGTGFALAGGNGGVTVECEAYGCNSSNTADSGGFVSTGPMVYKRCISHDNTGSNNNGWAATAATVYLDCCIASANGKDGVFIDGNTYCSAKNSDFYNNGRDGIELNATFAVADIENCNFILNAGFGVRQVGGATRDIWLRNNGYGSGTAANTSGTTSGIGIQETGAVTYAANLTPWVDPAHGDWRINLGAALGAGRGAFTETDATHLTAPNTVGYPDIGAAQSAPRRPAARTFTGM